MVPYSDRHLAQLTACSKTQCLMFSHKNKKTRNGQLAASYGIEVLLTKFKRRQHVFRDRSLIFHVFPSICFVEIALPLLFGFHKSLPSRELRQIATAIGQFVLDIGRHV